MKIVINGLTATLVKDDTLIQNSDKVYTVEFEFDESWDEYDKTVIFKAGNVSEEFVLSGNTCVIPKKCLEKGGSIFKVIVRGVSLEDEREVRCNTSRILFGIVSGASEGGSNSGAGYSGGSSDGTTGGLFIIEGEYVQDVSTNDLIIRADSTAGEILDAFMAGKAVAMVIEASETSILYLNLKAVMIESGDAAMFIFGYEGVTLSMEAPVTFDEYPEFIVTPADPIGSGQPGGSDSAMLVVLDFSGQTYTSNHTSTEILAAYEAGVNVSYVKKTAYSASSIGYEWMQFDSAMTSDGYVQVHDPKYNHDYRIDANGDVTLYNGGSVS